MASRLLKNLGKNLPSNLAFPSLREAERKGRRREEQPEEDEEEQRQRRQEEVRERDQSDQRLDREKKEVRWQDQEQQEQQEQQDQEPDELSQVQKLKRKEEEKGIRERVFAPVEDREPIERKSLLPGDSRVQELQRRLQEPDEDSEQKNTFGPARCRHGRIRIDCMDCIKKCKHNLCIDECGICSKRSSSSKERPSFKSKAVEEAIEPENTPQEASSESDDEQDFKGELDREKEDIKRQGVPEVIEVIALRSENREELSSLFPDIYWVAPVRGLGLVQGIIHGSELETKSGLRFIRNFTELATGRSRSPSLVEVSVTADDQYVLRIEDDTAALRRRAAIWPCGYQSPRYLRSVFFISDRLGYEAEKWKVVRRQNHEGFMVAAPLGREQTFTFLFAETARVFAIPFLDAN